MTMNVKYNTMNVKLGQTLGGVEGQGGLACCSPWGRKESDTTERLNWTELSVTLEARS